MSAVAPAATVGDVFFESEHKVMAPVEHAEPRTSRSGRRYLPRSIEVRWAQDTDHGWRCGWISLYGPQIRKDGSYGTREINEAIRTFPDGTPEPLPPWVAACAASERMAAEHQGGDPQ